MIHSCDTYREAHALLRRGERGPAVIIRPHNNGYLVFDTVEEARGHPSTKTEQAS